jgi:SAM-dependent methyltransferase
MNAASGARSAASIAFDRLAPEYDALAGGEIFQLLRAQTHRVFGRRFQPGSRVLEIGCGTGVDTQFFASRGVSVVACDPSEEMVSRTLRRLAHEGLDEHSTVVPCGVEDLQAYLEALGLSPRFDGIVSNFGALNCVPNLAPLAALVRQNLEPGGAVVLGLMTRICVLEAAYFVATRRPRLVGRRLGNCPVNVAVAGVQVPTYYHRVRDVIETLGRDVGLESVVGIGVAIPPPYLEARWRRLPRRLRVMVNTLDGWLSPWPPFNRLGDHMLLCFTREPAHA